MAQKKLNYEKPTIIRHNVGVINKFGQIPDIAPAGKVEGVPAKELIEKYGSPLYVVSENILRKKYQEMQRAFSLRYPKMQIAYSYKTNYLSAVCAILHSEGAFAEVVSGFEYDIAKSLNVAGEQIIFNGPHKTKEELLKAVNNNSKINVDSYDEIYLLEEIAGELNKEIEIGIRINMDLNYPPWDRFGFNVESGHAYEAIKRIIATNKLKVVGVHIHIGTYVTDVNLYYQMAEKLILFCDYIQKDLSVQIKYLDIGGGYASVNTLHSAYLPGELTCPSFDQYAETICSVLLRGPFKTKNLPILFLEPGRAIVDTAMFLLTSVVSTKRLSTGYKAIIVDAGVNLLPTAWWYKHDVISAKEWSGISEEVNIYGPLCMQIDVLRTGLQLPPLRRGDILIIKNVGAYNFSQSMQFIQPRPAIVLINNKKSEIIREKENLQYIKQLEKIPEYLKKKNS